MKLFAEKIAIETTTRDAQLERRKKQLMGWVVTEANRPFLKINKIVPSVALEGLCKDYRKMCMGQTGGMKIVYDVWGTGKTYALQGVARAKSQQQPRRFLVINTVASKTAQEWFTDVKERLGLKDLDWVTPTEVANAVMYGLLGPDHTVPQDELPKTQNKCRLSIDATVPTTRRTHDLPVLVLDEFNPSDFCDSKWPEGTDYTLEEVNRILGESFTFLNELAGLAHSCGFVVFVGTRFRSVARALHKINGGTKAALVRSTTCTPNPVGGEYPFEDWRGFQWSPDAKADVLKEVLGERFKKAVESQGFSFQDSQTRLLETIHGICSDDEGRNIRTCIDMMEDAVEEQESLATVLLQSRTQESEAPGCFAELLEQIKVAGSDGDCAIL